jgi:hypothetical protein
MERIMEMKLGTEKHRAALAADDVWSIELQKVFGRHAGDARYTKAGQGRPGSTLNEAYRAWALARDAWDHARH